MNKMKLWRLTKEQYEKLYKKLNINRQFDSNGYSNAAMTDIWLGTGDQHRKEYLNPIEMPLFIDYHCKYGTVRFYWTS